LRWTLTHRNQCVKVHPRRRGPGQTRAQNEGPGSLATPAPAYEGPISHLAPGARRGLVGNLPDVYPAAPVVVVAVVPVIVIVPPPVPVPAAVVVVAVRERRTHRHHRGRDERRKKQENASLHRTTPLSKLALATPGGSPLPPPHPYPVFRGSARLRERFSERPTKTNKTLKGPRGAPGASGAHRPAPEEGRKDGGGALRRPV
jgi:hypothetical protein